MPGAWLEALGRRLLHQDTFELVLSPAIADLQFESPDAGLVGVTRCYAGVAAAILGALLQDVGSDLHGLLDDGPVLGGLILLQTGYYSCILLLLTTGMSAEEVASRLSDGQAPFVLAVLLCLVAVSAALTLLCFWPERRVRE